MKRVHLGYEYSKVDDASRLKHEEFNNDLIKERLGEIFKDMKKGIQAVVREYSAEC
jgi:predicted double-glycine peptidase